MERQYKLFATDMDDTLLNSNNGSVGIKEKLMNDRGY